MTSHGLAMTRSLQVKACRTQHDSVWQAAFNYLILCHVSRLVHELAFVHRILGNGAAHKALAAHVTQKSCKLNFYVKYVKMLLSPEKASMGLGHVDSEHSVKRGAPTHAYVYKRNVRPSGPPACKLHAGVWPWAGDLHHIWWSNAASQRAWAAAGAAAAAAAVTAAIQEGLKPWLKQVPDTTKCAWTCICTWGRLWSFNFARASLAASIYFLMPIYY